MYLALCALVAYLGRNRKFGSWGYFFASFLLTPVVGLMLVYASYQRAIIVPTTPVS